MKSRWVWVVSFVSAQAAAAVPQPGGALVPVAPIALEQSLVTNSYLWNVGTPSYHDLSGAPLTEPIVFGQFYAPPDYPQFEDGDAITLRGLFKWRKESIDWLADAASPAGAFVPSCALTVEPVLLGGTCKSTFGWYNVPDPSSKTPPQAGQVYEIVPQDLASFMDCRTAAGQPKTDGFCPLAWDNRHPIDLSQKAWTPRQVPVDLRRDPRYQGGAIGFALWRDAETSTCGSSRFSVREHNSRSLTDEPFIGAVVYESQANPGAVYLAFEDGPMPPADWTNGGKTEGDYNDYVVYVSGCFDGSSEGGAGAGGAPSGGEPSSSGSASGGAPSGGQATTGGGAGALGGSAPSGGSRSEGGEGSPTEEGGASGTAGTHAGSGGASTTESGCGCRLGLDAHRGVAAPWLALAVALFVRRTRRSA